MTVTRGGCPACDETVVLADNENTGRRAMLTPDAYGIEAVNTFTGRYRRIPVDELEDLDGVRPSLFSRSLDTDEIRAVNHLAVCAEPSRLDSCRRCHQHDCTCASEPT